MGDVTSPATNPTESATSHAEMFFDPLCPWAWMTSRWLLEAAQVRDLEISFSIMSLSVLNEGRDLPQEYRAMMNRAWGPVRVLVKAATDHGDEVLGGLYTAIGTRKHPGGRGNDEDDMKAVVSEALDEVGLPQSLLEVWDNVPGDEIDTELRARHQRAIDLVGDDVGTPVVKVEDVAFFGPVVTPAPKGEAAGKLWDGCLLVAGTPGFYEMKRSREAGPDFS
ncbi:disulfide bond formation protein DsbA [Dermacoccaceae bacterium W4C1]